MIDTATQDSPLRSVHTSNFPDLLAQSEVSLLVSTYQAGKVLALRADGGMINPSILPASKPTGLALSADRSQVAIGMPSQITELGVVRGLDFPDQHDARYLPQRIHITGKINTHEMVYVQDELWFINTQFSCLCTTDGIHSFVPRWRPPFITAYDRYDRCHLNGLGVRDGQPRYVTTLGETDIPLGWRANKAKGGTLIDIQTNQILCRGLSMPHSPRWYADQLWVLDSGRGSLVRVDLATGELTTVVELPGFTRGLDFWGPLAFIGLSQVRETATFGGIPITNLPERFCGVWVVNIHTGEIVASLQFEEDIQEIFAVTVLPGICFPELSDWDEKQLESSFDLPNDVIQEMTKLKPEDAERLVDYQLAIANGAYKDGKPEWAVKSYKNCLTLKPDLPEARYNLGIALFLAKQWQEATAEFQQVIAAEPNRAEAYNYLGMISQFQDQLPEAIAHYQQAVHLCPNNPNFHLNLSIVHLQNGDLQPGFAEFEWRWQTQGLTPFDYPQPLWDGRKLPGQTLLIPAELGLSDALQFIRYLPLVAQRCQRVILVCLPELLPLLTTVEGIDKVLTPNETPLPEFHAYAPLTSLPHLLGTTLETIPHQVPYLSIPANEKIKILPTPHLKVGFAWAGSPRKNHNCSLTDFQPVLQTPGVTFYNFQQPISLSEQTQLQEYHVQDLSSELVNLGDLAATIARMDLVISVDTAVVHLAGALGKPVWNLLGYNPDWRWMLERPDSPWYPTMLLFRQLQPGDWAGVSKQVAGALRALVIQSCVRSN